MTRLLPHSIPLLVAKLIALLAAASILLVCEGLSPLSRRALSDPTASDAVTPAPALRLCARSTPSSG